MNAEDKCFLILQWALEHEGFDTTFVDSVQRSIMQYGSATSRQENGLDNIISSFQMLETEESDG